MQMRLLHLLGLLAVAGEAGVYGIRLNESRRASGMGIVTGGAIALRTWMLEFRFLDLLSLLAMAADADKLHVGLRWDNLAIFGRLMAGVALSSSKRRMRLGLHQLLLS